MLDRSAQAAQLARVFAHAGEPLRFGALPFAAAIEPWQPTPTDADRNVGDDTCVLVKAPRAVFGDKLPRSGQHFSDAAGRLYRIEGVRSLPPTHPLAAFICSTA